ncbi:MAG: endonuclease/exonuclease/phosphatase family protein [Planctomycetaceae bacterium]
MFRNSASAGTVLLLIVAALPGGAFECGAAANGMDGGAFETLPKEFPGSKSDWYGFERSEFEVDGRPVIVVAPKTEAEGRPWVWHGEFFGHKPAPDIELLHRGFHIVYMRVPDMLGAPKAVEHWNALYAELTGRYGFAKKAALVGLSRGGLYCYNWAIANPDRVACIYADAAVCDFKSWPGGKGTGKGSPRDWKLVMDVYGFSSEQEALDYRGNPVDQLKPLAEAGVPLLHVYGDADDVVPWDENTGIVAERYRAMNGDITLIAKPGVNHHPHGLDDPTPIVEFIERHSRLRNKGDSGSLRLRVLCYNIHHAEGVDGRLDVERIARVIQSERPDLVSLQEVDQTVDRTDKVNQPDELARLTGYRVLFGANIELQGGHYGNAILSRWPAAQHTNHLLPCLENGEQRGILDASFRLPTESTVRLLATHFDHRPNHAERELSAQFANDLLSGNSKQPTILAGDLNAVLESKTLATLLTQWQSTTGTDPLATIPVSEPNRQIDFILFRPASAWHLIECRVLPEAVASDHRAIMAVIELKPLNSLVH